MARRGLTDTTATVSDTTSGDPDRPDFLSPVLTHEVAIDLDREDEGRSAA